MKNLIILLIFGVLIACNDTSELKSASYELDDVEEVYENEETIIESAEYDESSTQNNRSVRQEQKIIKTANLRFETSDIAATHKKILSLTSGYNGFVQNDNSGRNYNTQYIKMTIRVPSEKFQTVLSQISEGVGFFDRKEITQKDVTEEFVDINARLKAKRKLENRYLELLQKAKNVKEMLEIERNLSVIREEIEAKEGRLKFLQNRVSLSTFYIEFYKTSEVKNETVVSYGQKIINALKGGWNGISNFFLGILYIWPFIILLGVAIHFTRKYIKKRRNKNN